MPLFFSAIVFAIFEKINKERFVINQTNQCTRKLFGELIDSCTPTITVNMDGNITFFNKPFRSLVCDGLEFESLPSNIFDILQDDQKNMSRLQQMLEDAFFSDAKDRDENHVLEMRIMKKTQPEVNRLHRRSTEESKEAGDSVKKQTNEFSIATSKTSMKMFEMVKITCQVS